MKHAVLLFGLVIAAAVSALVSSLVYAGLTDAVDPSAHLFDALQGDLLASYWSVRRDLADGDWPRAAMGLAVGLLAGGGVFIVTIAGKKNSTDARFLRPEEAGALGLTHAGGVFIGRIGGHRIKVPGAFTQRGSGRRRLTRPMLIGGKRLWIDGDDLGGFVIGPPRSGKGAALIVPNCLLWPDSLVVVDMRGETYAATAGYRSSFSRVLRFSPADENGDTECYNPLDFVALDPDQRDIDINSIAMALLPTPKGDAYWISDGRALFAGVTSWVLEHPEIDDTDKNLRTVLNVIEGGDRPLREWLEEVTDPRSRAQWISSFTYTTLARLAVMASKQFDGVYGALATAVRPFKNNRVLRATARSTFDIRAMRRENMSLYLDFRIQQIASIAPIFNVLVVQFMDYMSRTMMTVEDRRVLVLLDEFQNLGKLENAVTVATVLGGYGVPCWFFVQSLSSIDTLYTREDRKTLVNAARAQIFLGAQDPEDQRYVSQLLGERHDVTIDKAISTGVTLFDRKGTTVSHRTSMRPLMRPDEVGAMNENRCIIKLRNQRPILGLLNVYYADRLLKKRAWLPVKRRPHPERCDLTAGHVLETSGTVSPLAAKAGPGCTPGARFAAHDERSPGDALSNIRPALRTSRIRQDDAARSIAAVLAVFDGSPAKVRAVRAAEQDILSAFDDD